MLNSVKLPNDVVSRANAVSAAIAAEELGHAKVLLTACTQAFLSCGRSPDEVGRYAQWLFQQQAAVRGCREHLALRLSVVNASQYGRADLQITWGIDA